MALIGASALALHTGLSWRATNDIDIVVGVGLDQYPGGLADRAGWSREREGEHAWRSPEGVKVDIVPAGPELLKRGKLTWPRSGFEMNLTGLRLAFEHGLPLPLSESASVLLATLPTLAVLKLVAFLDRPEEREDDLRDIAYLLESFLADLDARRFQLISENVSYDNSAAYAMGLDIKAIVNQEEETSIRRFLEDASDESGRTHARLIRVGPRHWNRDPDLLPGRLNAFARGLERPGLGARP